MPPCSSLHQSMSSLERKLISGGSLPPTGRAKEQHWGSYSIGLLRGSWNVREGGQSTCCQGLWPQVLVFSDPDTTNPPIAVCYGGLFCDLCFEILSLFTSLFSSLCPFIIIHLLCLNKVIITVGAVEICVVKSEKIICAMLLFVFSLIHYYYN